MRWVGVALVLSLGSTPGVLGEALVVTDATTAIGCAEVHGTHVAFLAPQRGIVLLATQPFPGGREVGTLREDHLAAEIPGFGSLDLATGNGAARTGSSGTPIWGMLDRSLDIGDQTGCFGFGPRRFSDIDDLKTYLHWFVREVLERLPQIEGEPAPSVWLAGRRMTLQIESANHRPLQIRGTEGSTLGFQPDDVPHRFYLQPFVLGRAAKQAAVRVSIKEGDFFGPGSIKEIAFVVLGPDEATPLGTNPPIGLRLTAIEARVSFDD